MAVNTSTSNVLLLSRQKQGKATRAQLHSTKCLHGHVQIAPVLLHNLAISQNARSRVPADIPSFNPGITPHRASAGSRSQNYRSGSNLAAWSTPSQEIPMPQQRSKASSFSGLTLTLPRTSTTTEVRNSPTSLAVDTVIHVTMFN